MIHKVILILITILILSCSKEDTIREVIYKQAKEQRKQLLESHIQLTEHQKLLKKMIIQQEENNKWQIGVFYYMFLKGYVHGKGIQGPIPTNEIFDMANAINFSYLSVWIGINHDYEIYWLATNICPLYTRRDDIYDN